VASAHRHGGSFRRARLRRAVIQAEESKAMSFHNCICHQTPCICGSDQEPPRMAFTPDTFSMLLNNSRKWFEMLSRLSKRREVYPQGIEAEAITIMLCNRARQLRN
jgi:hypothetical protein